MRSGYLFHALLAKSKNKNKKSSCFRLVFQVVRQPEEERTHSLTHSLTHSTQLTLERSTRTPGRSWARPIEQLASLPDTSLSWDAK